MKKNNEERFTELIREGSTLSDRGRKTIIVDTVTGVNYLYVQCGYGGGITPLYNADGTLVVTKEDF